MRTPFCDMSYQLIDDNIVLLKSAIELLASFDDERFSRRQQGGEKSGVGPHLRHVIDHYKCLLAAAETERIDYDHRERDNDSEHSVSRAKEILYELVAGLEDLKDLGKDHLYLVRMDCGTNNETGDQEWCRSTLGRELQFLVSHTVHHFAIIDLYCYAMGIAVPDGFGVAPSTLKYLKAGNRR